MLKTNVSNLSRAALHCRLMTYEGEPYFNLLDARGVSASPNAKPILAACVLPGLRRSVAGRYGAWKSKMTDFLLELIRKNSRRRAGARGK